MAGKGAEELWGIDLSSSQIETAKDFLKEKNIDAHLFCAPMEKEIDLPKNYFDIIYSIYALGWTTDLKKTLELIYTYLKKDGIFVFSWDHPIYPCVEKKEEDIVFDKSYFNEGLEYVESFRGEPIYLNRIRLSTYINELSQAGFKIERLIEGDLSKKYQTGEVNTSGKYYTLDKATKVPSSFIMKVRKL